jgi:hypothetical protein
MSSSSSADPDKFELILKRLILRLSPILYDFYDDMWNRCNERDPENAQTVMINILNTQLSNSMLRDKFREFIMERLSDLDELYTSMFVARVKAIAQGPTSTFKVRGLQLFLRDLLADSAAVARQAVEIGYYRSGRTMQRDYTNVTIGGVIERLVHIYSPVPTVIVTPPAPPIVTPLEKVNFS